MIQRKEAENKTLKKGALFELMIFSELIMNKLKRVQIKSKTFIEKTQLDKF